MQLSSIFVLVSLGVVYAAPQPTSPNPPVGTLQAQKIFTFGNVKVANDFFCGTPLPYGQEVCADIINPDGSHYCDSCAIIIGNDPDGSECSLNNLCAPTDGSCIYENGSTFCQ